MSIPYHQLEFLIEDVVAEFIRQQDDPGCTVYTSLEADTWADRVSAPCVSVVCDEFGPLTPEAASGTQSAAVTRLVVRVTIRTQVAPTKEGAVEVEDARQAHAHLKARVADVFQQSDIVAALNAVNVPGIVVMYWDFLSGRRTPEGRGTETELTYEAHARAVEVT